MIVQAFARQSLADLAINAASIYRLNLSAFVGICAIPYAVLSLVDIALGVTRPLMTDMLFLSVAFIVNTITFVAATRIAAGTVDGTPIDAASALAWAWRTPLVSIIFATLIVAVAIGFGLVLLVIPGLIVAVRAVYLTLPFLYEGAGIAAAMRRSSMLVKGDFFHTAALLLFFGGVPYLLISYILYLVEQESALLVLVTIVIGAAWAPLFPIAMFLGYIEMRAVKDNYLPDELHADLEDIG